MISVWVYVLRKSHRLDVKQSNEIECAKSRDGDIVREENFVTSNAPKCHCERLLADYAQACSSNI